MHTCVRRAQCSKSDEPWSSGVHCIGRAGSRFEASHTHRCTVGKYCRSGSSRPSDANERPHASTTVWQAIVGPTCCQRHAMSCYCVRWQHHRQIQNDVQTKPSLGVCERRPPELSLQYGLSPDLNTSVSAACACSAATDRRLLTNDNESVGASGLITFLCDGVQFL